MPRILREVLVSGIAGLAVLALSHPAAAQKQTLKVAHWAGPSHLMVEALGTYADKVAKASGGNLTLEIDKAPLAKPPGQYDLIKNGIRDMGWHVPGYTPGRFDMLRVAEIPFLCPSPVECAPALWNWYTKNGLDEKEFTDTKPMAIFMHGPGNVHTTKLVKSLDDIKGLKIRVGGAGVPIAKALGMTVVAMPATEAHSALQHGTVDGVLFPWEAMNSFKLADITKFHLEVPGGMYTATFTVNMNPKSWAGLNQANKDALMSVSGVAGSKLFGTAWHEADLRARADGQKMGATINKLSDEQLKRWEPLLDFVRVQWLQKAKERGLDGEKLLADFKASVKAQM